MPGQEVNPQPIAKFAPGKTYVIKGETLNKLLQGNLPVRAGKGLKVSIRAPRAGGDRGSL